MSNKTGDQFSERDSRLTESDVREILASYKDAAVTDELYRFGQVMVEKALERFKSLDTKATAIAAYSIGIITLLVSTQTTWAKTLQAWAFLPVFCGLTAFISAACAVSALWLRKTNWFSQYEWLNPKHVANVEALRRYHLINMWGVLSSHQTACDGKATRIMLAEGSLIASGFLLLLTLGTIAII